MYISHNLSKKKVKKRRRNKGKERKRSNVKEFMYLTIYQKKWEEIPDKERKSLM